MSGDPAYCASGQELKAENVKLKQALTDAYPHIKELAKLPIGMKWGAHVVVRGDFRPLAERIRIILKDTTDETQDG